MIRAIISIGFCLWHIALTAQSVDQRALKLRESGNGDRAELALLIDQSTGDWNAYLMAVKSPNDIPEKRIEIWAQLLENFQESQDEIGVLLCADLLSAEYASLRRVGEAKNYCRKCISNAKDLSILIEAECYINLATTYRFNAEYQNALRAADSAIFLAQNNSNNAIYGRSLFSKGSVYQLNNRLDSAMLFYAKSAEVYLQLLDT
ncbi:MAG TPA: hypothetical protein DCX14_12100, partial [Flavobacteriales bacterium]|nr:hypothetical protein [Flavobacteriales bacterium]